MKLSLGRVICTLSFTIPPSLFRRLWLFIMPKGLQTLLRPMPFIGLAGVKCVAAVTKVIHITIRRTILLMGNGLLWGLFAPTRFSSLVAFSGMLILLPVLAMIIFGRISILTNVILFFRPQEMRFDTLRFTSGISLILILNGALVTARRAAPMMGKFAACNMHLS